MAERVKREKVLREKQMEVFQAKMTYLLKKREFEYMSEYAYIVEGRRMKKGRMEGPPEADNVADNGRFLPNLAENEKSRVGAHNHWLATTNEISAVRTLISRLEAGEDISGRNLSMFGSPRNETHARARTPQSTSGYGSPSGKKFSYMSVTLPSTPATATKNIMQKRTYEGKNNDETEECFKIARREFPVMDNEDVVEDIDGGISDSEIVNIPDLNEKKDDLSNNNDEPRNQG